MARINSILNQVHRLLEEYPGYRLYCTGHSLVSASSFYASFSLKDPTIHSIMRFIQQGAALSTLFGFFVAAHEKTAKLLDGPVRVVSIASPYVGNVKFLLAFQSLERSGRLQHLRIANAEDVVTLMPVVGPKIGIVSPILAMTGGVGNLYKHCGLKLQLKRKPFEDGNIYQISYPLDQSTDESYANEITSMLEDGKNFISAIKKVFNKEASTVAGYHSCEEYERRLNIIRDDLMKKTLTDLYKDKTIVGNVLDPGFKPVVMTSAKERINRITGSKVLQNKILGRE